MQGALQQGDSGRHYSQGDSIKMVPAETHPPMKTNPPTMISITSRGDLLASRKMEFDGMHAENRCSMSGEHAYMPGLHARVCHLCTCDVESHGRRHLVPSSSSLPNPIVPAAVPVPLSCIAHCRSYQPRRTYSTQITTTCSSPNS